LISVFYRLDFAASASGPPAGTVAVNLCGIENVTVHEIPGPRTEQDEKLFQAASQLLPTWPSRIPSRCCPLGL
jgi:hypothetical protein